MSELIRSEIGKEVFFSKVTDQRYKINRISINFLTRLNGETASVNAIVPRILAKSCEKYPTYAQLNNKLSALYSASLGDNVSKAGDMQWMRLSVTAIDDAYALENEKISEEATDILLECLFRPLLENGVFSEKVTALERQALIDDIEAEINDKRGYALDRASDIMFDGEPAAVREMGKTEDAEKITAQSAFESYRSMLENCRIEIICIGCNDFSGVEKKLADAFSKIARESIIPCESQRSPLKEILRSETEKLAVTQSKMVIGFKIDSDDCDAIALMSAVFGGTTTSKLFLNVREKLSLCYYCWSKFYRQKRVMLVDCGVENENIEKARLEIYSQLEKMKTGDFTDKDIEYAKLYLENSYKTISDSVRSVEGWYFSGIYNNEIETPQTAISKALAVSRERIVAAANAVNLDSVYVLTSLDAEEGV